MRSVYLMILIEPEQEVQRNAIDYLRRRQPVKLTFEDMLETLLIVKVYNELSDLKSKACIPQRSNAELDHY